MEQRRKLPHEERLALAAAFLERLDEERAACGDPTQDTVIEERIVWRELLDLELQEFDDEIGRLFGFSESLRTGAENGA